MRGIEAVEEVGHGLEKNEFDRVIRGGADHRLGRLPRLRVAILETGKLHPGSSHES
jgi:hypothetical protein